MRKIFLFLVLLIISLFSINNIYAIGVDEVFTDITKDYKYYNELQDLYDKGIIKADKTGFFYPNELLQRDDFVGIVSEVSCNKCIYPNTPADLVSKYYGLNIFFDLTDLNKNFYCIADMKDKGFVKGYDKGYTCSDGSMSENESPFCATNYVTREEAVAVLLRSSNIFTVEDNTLVKQKIIAGDITTSLASDVQPIKQGVVNTFYGYLRKALNYGFTDKVINSDGDLEEKQYKLIELDENDKINPDKPLTREEYIKMAYIIFRKNSCNFKLTDENNLSTQIEVLDSDCTENTTNCSEANTSKNKYDFNAKVSSECDSGIKSYKWVFNYLGNTTSSYNKIITTKYVDDYDFKDNSGKLLAGKWNITLEVIDNCGSSSTVNKSLYIGDDSSSDFSFNMTAAPKVGYVTLNTKFSATVFGNTGNVSYSWVFGDGYKTVGRVVEHAYTEAGNYSATLIIEDKLTGKKVTDSVVIKVLEKETTENQNKDEDTTNDTTTNNSSVNTTSSSENLSDIDGDGILDKDDYCVSVYGVKENNGCPIFNSECSVNSDCSKGKVCDDGYCVLDSDGDGVPDSEDNCRLTAGLTSNDGCPEGAIGEDCYVNKDISGVCGSATCNSCPCANEVDFKADLRKCDLVFPTILSPDGKDIYAKGQNKVIEK